MQTNSFNFNISNVNVQQTKYLCTSKHLKCVQTAAAI